MLGPGGFYGKEWFDSFLMNVGRGVVDGVTHHTYNLGAGMYLYILFFVVIKLNLEFFVKT